jgi:hypothetical protein
MNVLYLLPTCLYSAVVLGNTKLQLQAYTKDKRRWIKHSARSSNLLAAPTNNRYRLHLIVFGGSQTGE